MDNDFLTYFITEELFLLKELADTHTSQDKVQLQATLVAEAPVAGYEGRQNEPVQPADLAIWTPPLTSQDRELLDKILGSIQKDFSVVRIDEGITAYNEHFKQLLCFGYHKELELKVRQSLTLYQPAKVDSREFIVSISLQELHGNTAGKAELWKGLKKMFFN